ncbi:3',5'-cyclic-nucleotide phosphodiesterase [Nitrosomonas sp. JL21]|uniref:3',5'-cyclic-nucleotide phosphodiesterase n=1 Tax=Nitrosomonas sp. JL21 TaxID=153949 RepID=UPI00136AA396|nr:3',5'-cyclic-nucleotide phosphodiesterase [Nitrosomonas sp. JL21]MBL8498242.1 3',5'-cyclic-nucleotide phosphodiesterase [Nitrosomonas sp.]MCC7091013.1 3',5'-cyclic-nucleotide phosphodiesterase [Nitrosomonas sp.]MXS77726.1 3',5'-cyclic-nucleotide phosphodiesterase [Nitrosomonas sp. JL21]
MKLRILGCSGGIGSDAQTTAMLLDEDVLIDAGTGVGNLNLDELIKIDHVFVTHAHLDHVACIPFLIDTVGSLRTRPITVHAIQATLTTLQSHLFNWQLWPDFARIPTPSSPYLQYQPLALGDVIDLEGRKIIPLPANHVVPAVGYQLDSGRASLIFTGDTTSNPALWSIANQIENLKYLIIESAFCNQKRDIAVRSKHLCPSLLAEELEKFERDAEIFISHLKPGEADVTMAEIQHCIAKFNPRRLENNQLFEF